MGYLAWSYQLLFLQSLLFHSQTSATHCSHDQSSALLQFKQLFSFKNTSFLTPCEFYTDPSYSKMMSWKEDDDCCSWDGVTCDSVTGDVIALDLSCSWLSRSIPSNITLFFLPQLQRLNLAFNDFHLSQISSDFGLFPSLTHLNLSGSNFSGPVPSEISHLSKLVSLDLSDNFFYPGDEYSRLRIEAPVLERLVQNLTMLMDLSLDTVDMSSIVPSSLSNLSSTLISLSLRYCGLQGSFPDHIFRLPNLEKLTLISNYHLTGNFPKVNWSSPLKFLYVSDMSLPGELPNSFSNLITLRHLILDNCNLVGSVPASFGNLSQLTLLDLSFNYFHGQIPSSLSRLDKLRELRLLRNNFIGNIPIFFVNLTQLSSLDISSNQFVGPIPDILFNLKQLSSIDLSNNGLDGPIPCHVSGPASLEFIDLCSNSLNGTIPSWLFSLPFLKFMDLSFNQLTGCIDEFQSCSLEVIRLESNRLQGTIPSSLFELVNLTDLVLSTNNLSGIVELHMFSKLKKLRYLYLSHNSLSVTTIFKLNSSFPQLFSLGLSACNFSEFPAVLKSLDLLYILDLSQNTIHGQIPNWMWNISKDSLLWLNLSHNYLTSIEQLPWENLEFLDLHSNLLQGQLPIPPPHLRLFFLSNNKLTGEIPPLTCNMSVIEILDLSNNNLSGIIPECIGNFSSLHVLDLRKNRFYGTIPRTFAKGNYFRTLDFNNNELEGSVPQALLNCSKLEVLDLGNNKINDTFPYWLGNLPELRVLVLRSNKFYGSDWDCSNMDNCFPNLKILDLSNNYFSGLLPAEHIKNLKAMMDVNEAERKLQYMGEEYYQDSVNVTLKGFEIELVKIITTFTTIDFSNNNFLGEIPEVIGKLHALCLLNLSHNNLSGCIPSSLGNLSALESLDLSSNKLVGKIPWQLTRLNFLQVVNLSQNHLSGPIPRDNHFDTFQNNSYDGNFALCGFPLSNNCRTYNDTPQPPSTLEDDAESSSGFGWKVVLIGYGCGMVLGVMMGHLVFSTGKPQWLVRIVE